MLSLHHFCCRHQSLFVCQRFRSFWEIEKLCSSCWKTTNNIKIVQVEAFLIDCLLQKVRRPFEEETYSASSISTSRRIVNCLVCHSGAGCMIHAGILIKDSSVSRVSCFTIASQTRFVCLALWLLPFTYEISFL